MGRPVPSTRSISVQLLVQDVTIPVRQKSAKGVLPGGNRTSGDIEGLAQKALILGALGHGPILA
jgi:hypothetical protein